MSFSIASALKWWSRDMPDVLALSVDGDPATFAEIYDWSGRVAGHLLDRGVKAGDFVMMVGLNSIDYAMLILALARIGAVGAPLTFRSAAPGIAEGLGSFSPVMLFTDDDRAPAARDALAMAGSSAELRNFREIAAFRTGKPRAIDIEVDRDAPLFIINTSGSTAKSKSVVQTQFGVMTYGAELVVMEPRCGRGARFLSLGPFSSASGYLLMFQFLTTGVTIHMETKFESERALDLLVDKRITMLLGVPIFFERISALPAFADADLSHLYYAQVAGARVQPALLEAWQKKGVMLRHAYGCTEAGGGWAARNDTALTAPEKAGRGGIYNEFAILGQDGGIAPPDTVGEILFRGAALMAGYWNNPQANAEAIQDGWFRTGDLGTVDAGGNLTFVDRLKDIIISGGLNISAAEVERVIADIDGVEEVAVIAAQDDRFGETPMAIVYGDRTRLSVPDIIAHCDRMLASYKVPRYIVLEDAPLPRLPSGKLAKPAIRARYRDAADSLAKVR
jgi:fatty-acyl-CoA synthase